MSAYSIEDWQHPEECSDVQQTTALYTISEKTDDGGQKYFALVNRQAKAGDLVVLLHKGVQWRGEIHSQYGKLKFP